MPLLTIYRSSQGTGRADTSLIVHAYEVARAAHEGQVRRSGDPYIQHPLAVAKILAELGLDDITLSAALLHDSVEDTGVTLEEVAGEFGDDVANIVDGVTKLDRVSFDSKEAQQAATMRKMLVAMAKDITPLLADVDAFRFAVDAIADHFAGNEVHKVLGVEARGFIIAAPVAYRFGAGFIPIRKAGKLPWEIEREEYELEYGSDLLEIHRDAVRPGENVLIVDDVLATGGTAAATVRLIERLGARVAGLGFVIELGFLNGRQQLSGRDMVSLLHYE